MVGTPERWEAAWRTVAPERVVLAAVHNVTAATRLLDVLPAVAADARIQVEFTCPGSSPFTRGTAAYLARRGIELLPWESALELRADVAVAASLGGDLHELTSPLVIIPHGMGYNKYLENRKSKIENRKSVFGLSVEWLMREGRLVPSVLALSHDEQLDRLHADCPEAVGVAAVIGDPCLDRLRASLPLRESYRQAFGLAPGQRLVVVSSTWGERSLFGHDPGLIRRLGASLPVDSHRVAVALHPNIAAGHGAWQVDTWLADLARDGVRVLPEEDLWRPALVAADLVIGDHGSVTFYAAALGIPVLLAAAPVETVHPASPIARLLRAAPRLGPADDLAERVEAVVSAHDPGAHAGITALATSRPGEAAGLFRDTVLDVLGLDPVAPRPGPVALPLPREALPRPRALLTSVSLVDGGATVLRYPVGAPNPPPDAHLVVDVDAPDAALLELAEIVVHPHPADARRWLAATLAALPGLLLAVAREAPGRWLVATADDVVRVDAPDAVAPAVASVLRAWLADGRAPADLPATLAITTGPATTRVALRPDGSVRPGPPAAPPCPPPSP